MINSLPVNDGFFMPAEFDEHDGCIMIWPERSGSWAYGAGAARKVFAQIAEAISESETVYMLVNNRTAESARAALSEQIRLVNIDTDDAWARDMCPTFVKNAFGTVRGVEWEFNAWGGDFDGLYADWKKDNAAARSFCEQLGYGYYNAKPFVLEGGSIHSDGEGTVITTEACLLSKGRNPDLTKKQIEEKLHDHLGAEKVIWLPRGIYNDETNEHVDNVCAFVRPAEVVLAWTDDENDPQYALSKADLEVLENETDARGRKLTVHKLLIPKKPVCVTENDLAGLEFEDGEDMREVGERLAASYANFYISNGAVILPVFGDINDTAAVELMKRLFPNRKVVPIFARDIITGGGNIHCITQQIPKGAKK